MSVLLVLVALLAGASAARAHVVLPAQEVDPGNIRVALDSAVSIIVSRTELERSGQQVEVQWAGVREPTSSDWIGLYSPVPDNVTTVAPMEFKPVSAVAGWQAGSGWMVLELENMRSDYIIYYFHGDVHKPVLVGASPVIRVLRPNEPTKVHLMMTARPTEVRVMWTTKDSAMPTVRYGKLPQQLTRTATARSRTYAVTDLCGPPATTIGWRDPGLQHDAVMKGLKPGARYYYRVGDPALDEWSDVYGFKVPPAAGADRGVTLALVADMGASPNDFSEEMYSITEPDSLRTSARLLQHATELDGVYVIGDVSYAQGYASHWDIFYNQVQPSAARMVWQQCIGNHERDTPHSGGLFGGNDAGGECGVPYSRHFVSPREDEGAGADEPWYSFEMGPVHIVVMSTEHNFSRGSEQYQWLEQDMAGVDRQSTPWLVFTGHRPMYVDSSSAGTKGSDLGGAEWLRQELEQMLTEYKVDLALWAHHHSYQRTCKVFNSTCLAASSNSTAYFAPVHLVVGVAGRSLSPLGKQEAFMELVDNVEFGWVRMAATATRLKLDYFLNDSGAIKDTLVLDNTAYRAAGSPPQRAAGRPADSARPAVQQVAAGAEDEALLATM